MQYSSDIVYATRGFKMFTVPKTIFSFSNSPGASPSSYILVPFNDPECGPATRTTDPEDFMEAVNGLTASGGGDPPEMFWCGLQKALATAPMFSDIICFTDVVGKDGQLLPSVKALANEKHSKVQCRSN